MSEQPKQKELTAEEVRALMEAMDNGLTNADLAGITDGQLEALYALGHNLYTAGRHQDAETVFQALCLYDYTQSRFWLGLAGSLQANGHYQKAAEGYSMAALSDGLKDPSPFYYAAICFLKMGDAESALGSLTGLTGLAEEGNPAHEPWVAKARNLAEVIRRPAQEGAARDHR
jgi:type III secretion system low calcium response chaperone LcrH/SycD